MTNILPVTKSEEIQNQISYSTKIGKQVMKAQLTKKLTEAKKVSKEKKLKHIEHKNFWVQSTKEYLQSKNKLSMRNDSEMTRLRNLLNKFNNDNFKTNLDMIEISDEHYVASSMFSLPPSIEEAENKIKNITKKGFQIVNTNLNIACPLDVKDCTYFSDSFERIGYNLEIYLSDEILESLETYLILYKDYLDAEIHLKNITQQLEKIDEVVEQMEAQLLVNELSSTEEGKKVLSVTSNLVSQMLGDTPSILKLNDK